MADVTKRLVGPKQLANSATTEYTVPGATTTTILSMRFSNPGTVDRTVTVSIGADAAGTRILDAYVVPAGSVLIHNCYEVMDAAEILQMSCSSATAVVATVSGVETT